LRLGPTFSTLKSLKFLSLGLPFRGTDAISDEGQGLNLNTVNATSLFSLQDLKNLSAISLAYCKIKNFDISVLENLRTLKIFDISHNNIDDLKVASLGLLDSTVSHNSNTVTGTRSSIFKKRKTKSFSKFDAPSNGYKLNNFEYQDSTFYCNRNNKFDLSVNSLTKTFSGMLQPGFSLRNFTFWLDLSSNLIITIRKNSFQNWNRLCGINLKDNPIRYIHSEAFHGLKYLKHLVFNSTKLIDQNKNTLLFLSNIESNFHLQMTSGHFFWHFKRKNRTQLLARNVGSIDLSKNEIISKRHLENAFHSFPNVTSIILRSCLIPFLNFNLSNKLVTKFDLSDNRLPRLPSNTLKNMPKLKTLFLSKNSLVTLNWNFANLTPNLEELDLSFNQIFYITVDAFNPAPKNLRKLLLHDNYLSQVAIELFSFDTLNHLYYFDIRWNDMGCDCRLTKTLGWWLTRADFKLEDRPGFLPACPSILDNDYFGGCVTCQVPQIASRVPLLKYACSKSCEELVPTIMCLPFLVCTLLFLLFGVAVKSPKWKIMLSKYILSDIFASRSLMRTKTNLCKQKFAFDAFVCFDLHDLIVGSWIDNYFIPNLDSSYHVTINGKNNPCGISPLTQLLFKLEASKKTIVVLSGSYGIYKETKYITSILEYLEYKTGSDRLIFIIFDYYKQSDRLVDKRRSIKPWSVLNVPKEPCRLPLFLNCINTLIQNL